MIPSKVLSWFWYDDILQPDFPSLYLSDRMTQKWNFPVQYQLWTWNSRLPNDNHLQHFSGVHLFAQLSKQLSVISWLHLHHLPRRTQPNFVNIQQNVLAGSWLWLCPGMFINQNYLQPNVQSWWAFTIFPIFIKILKMGSHQFLMHKLFSILLKSSVH